MNALETWFAALRVGDQIPFRGKPAVIEQLWNTPQPGMAFKGANGHTVMLHGFFEMDTMLRLPNMAEEIKRLDSPWLPSDFKTKVDAAAKEAQEDEKALARQVREAQTARRAQERRKREIEEFKRARERRLQETRAAARKARNQEFEIVAGHIAEAATQRVADEWMQQSSAPRSADLLVWDRSPASWESLSACEECGAPSKEHRCEACRHGMLGRIPLHARRQAALAVMGVPHLSPFGEVEGRTFRKNIIEGLSPRHQAMFVFRFLLEKTLEETAVYFGLTRERLRQLESKMIHDLRQTCRPQGDPAPFDEWPLAEDVYQGPRAVPYAEGFGPSDFDKLADLLGGPR